MSHKLAAFEFVAASDEPTIVQIFRGEDLLLQFGFIDWIGVDLTPFSLEFEERTDLVLKGHGLGHPFWNEEVPAWKLAWDPRQEAQRIKMIKQAAARQLNAINLVVAES